MTTRPRHPREAERLASLHSYHVLDTAPDPALDAVTAAVARALGTTGATITLVDHDRQWFKSVFGVTQLLGPDVRQTPLDVSFCADAVAQGTVLVVPDATADRRFAHFDNVTGPQHVRSYAGAPVIGRDGLPLGTLCVLDTEPRHHDAAALEVLRDLACTVAELLELRRLDVMAGLGPRDVLGESHRLRTGIDEGELVVHYQPVVDLVTHRWSGMEALARWAHPERGLLPPSAFLPLAEASGLVVPLGRDVLRRACAQAARWRREIAAAADLRVAVNVSARQLSEPDIVDTVTRALLDSGLPPHALTVELTETHLPASGKEVDIALQRIRSLGVGLALDDFGTGYASFSHLQRIHPDVVKLDRCFVTGLGRSPRDDLLAHTLIDLGLRLGCDVVAEGVEDRRQEETLVRSGVRSGQGFLYSTPRAPGHLTDLLLGRIVADTDADES